MKTKQTLFCAVLLLASVQLLQGWVLEKRNNFEDTRIYKTQIYMFFCNPVRLAELVDTDNPWYHGWMKGDPPVIIGYNYNFRLNPDTELGADLYGSSRKSLLNSWGCKVKAKRIVGTFKADTLAVIPALSYMFGKFKPDYEEEQLPYPDSLANHQDFYAGGLEIPLYLSHPLSAKVTLTLGAQTALSLLYSKAELYLPDEDANLTLQHPEFGPYLFGKFGLTANLRFRFKNLILIPEFGADLYNNNQGKILHSVSGGFAIGYSTDR